MRRVGACVICKRDGCDRVVPPFARLHADSFCSTACFKAHHGTLTADEERSELLSRRIAAGKDAA
jgi:hypothetical protein